jgi:DNA-binding NarL/FixJ family response regulator
MTPARVLVADDVSSILIAVTGLLRTAFEVVGTASNGKIALKSILELAPDVVILDVSMPAMSGLDVARELRRLGSKAKIVFLTSHEDYEILDSCTAVGGLGYVLKNSISTDLILAINEAFEGRAFISQFSGPREYFNGGA